MIDKFSTFSTGLSDPATNAFDISPSDSVNFAYATRWIWVGGAGDVTLVTIGGEVVTFTAIAAGTRLDVRASRVNLTGTDATLLVGMY